MIGRTIAHYQVLRKIGEGGQGEAYLAVDTRLGRPVVIKFMPSSLVGDEQARARLLREARLASQLDHPNICTIYEVNEFEGRLYIVMQYVEGMTLKKLISRNPLPIQTALAVAMQIADALVEAHERGIIHRDIKSSNIVITDKGRAVLLDFGLATKQRQAAPGSGEQPVSQSSPFGTVSYMSPEHVRGQDADARSDLFSFGVVLYEMITGQKPFNGKTADEVMTAILQEEPQRPSEIVSDVDEQLEEIALKLLRKSPDERYTSTAELRKDLNSVAARVGLEDSSGVRVLLVKAVGKERPATRLLLIAALALIAAGMVLVALLWFGKLSISGGEKLGPGLSQAPVTHAIAILPFRNLKQDPASDFIGYALADSITNNLAYVRRLIVRPPTSIEKHRTVTADIRQVGKELNVDTILSGSFVKEGRELRVNAQLVDVKSNSILWNEVINVQYDNLLTLQDTIAKNIVSQLQIRLSAEEEERLRKGISQNPLAYEYFLRGKSLGLTTNETKIAVELVRKAIELDPTYAPAWVELGWRLRQMSLFGLGSRYYYDEAQKAAEQALTVNPDSVTARVLLSYVLTEEGRLADAVNLLRRGLEISPNNPELHGGLRYAYRYGGMLEQSLAEFEKVRQLDPNFQDRPIDYVPHGLLYIGDYQKFLETIAQKEAPQCYFYRGFAYFHLGENDRAVAELQKAIRIDPNNVFSLLAKALDAKIKGKTGSGLKTLKTLKEKREKGGIPDGEMTYKLAQLYTQLGDQASSLRMLRKAVDQGFFCFPYIARDPLLEPIRSTSEYAPLIETIRQKHEAFKQKFFGS